MDHFEKKMFAQAARLKSRIKHSLKDNNGKIEFPYTAFVGKFNFIGMSWKNDEIYIILEDGKDLSLDDFYSQSDTSMTFNDFLDTLNDYLDETEAVG